MTGYWLGGNGAGLPLHSCIQSGCGAHPTLSYQRDTEDLLPLYSDGEIKDVWSFTFLSPLIWSWIAGTVLPLLLLSHFIVAIFSSDRNLFIHFFKDLANKNLHGRGCSVAPKLYRITNAKLQLFLALNGRGV